MKYMKLGILSICFFCWSCIPYEGNDPSNALREGYVPIYGSSTAAEIKLLNSRAIESPGKIYTYGKFLLVNEVNRGIHIFNNENPTDPKAIGFIQLTGNTDMAIRNDILYADYLGSLVALEVADFNTLKQVGKITISNWLLGVPPPSGSHFKCVEAGKGLVIGWKKASLNNPDCYAH